MERDEEGMSSGFKFWSIVMECLSKWPNFFSQEYQIKLLVYEDDHQLYTTGKDTKRLKEDLNMAVQSHNGMRAMLFWGIKTISR